MNSTYFIHLGTQQALARAEAEAVLGAGQAVLGDLLLGDWPAIAWQRAPRLAGAIRYGQVVGAATTLDEAQELIVRMLEPMRRPEYVIGVTGVSSSKAREAQKRLGLSIKKALRANGVASRWVEGDGQIASSAVIAKNNILTKGAELILMSQGKGWLIGRTEAVQDFEEWSAVDYGRPQRDAKRGMLPPKLARMMVNLALGETDITARAKKGNDITIYDPFCGVGTVLQEAARIGVSGLYGSDVDPRAINASEKNLTWLTTRTEMNRQWTLRVGEARAAAELFPELRVDGLVSETSLGTPQLEYPTPGDARVLARTASEVYRQALPSLSRLLLSGGRMVLAVPAWRTSTGGLQQTELPELKGLKLLTGGELLYAREDQIVGREIWVWEKA
jgi:tRNA G10  N-methylase Trm11